MKIEYISMKNHVIPLREIQSGECFYFADNNNKAPAIFMKIIDPNANSYHPTKYINLNNGDLCQTSSELLVVKATAKIEVDLRGD